MNPRQVLPTIIRDRAMEQPDTVVLEEIDGANYSYEQLHRRIENWAFALSSLGVRHNDTVATMLQTSAESYCVWLGLAWLGAVEVPIHTAYRGQMLAHVLETANCTVLICSREFLSVVEPALGVNPRLQVVALGCRADESAASIVPGADLLGSAKPAPLREPQPYDPACIIFTSGTTGPSKGVIVPWAQMYYAALSPPAGTILPGEAYYAFWPTFHVGGKYALYLPLARQGRVVLRQAFSASSFWTDVTAYGCSFALLIDSMVRFLNRQPPSDDDQRHDLRSVMIAPVSDEALAFAERFGVTLLTAFGMSEIGAPIAARVDELPDINSCGRLRSGSPGYQVRVVDAHDYEVERGEVGELIIRTDEPWTLNSGYVGMPEATARAWRNGWFHTGDAFRQDSEGAFYFVDRLKDTIRRRGENISSMELEAMVNTHPDVAESAAVGVPSEHGEEDVKLLIVPRDGRYAGPQALVDYLETIVPSFMVPRYIELVETLPKTEGTQRIQKNVLRARPMTDATWDREADSEGRRS